MSKPVISTKTTKMLYRNKLNARQLAVFFCAITMYLFYYFCKSNLSVATEPIQQTFGFSSAQFGIILTTASIVYAAGQFINGFLSDRIGAKAIFFIGAIGAIIGNFCFGFSSSLVLFVVTWAIATYFLSMGWAPSMKIVFDWFPQEKWGLYGGINNAFCFLGSALVTPLAGVCIANFGWKGAFFIPPLFTLVFAIIFLIVVKNTPRDAGFEVEWANDESLQKSSSEEKVGRKDYIKAFCNGKMQIGYFCDFFANMIRWVMVSWIVKILMDSPDIGGFGMAVVTASLVGSFVHWGGAAFSVISGWIQDKVFHGNRWQVMVISFLVGGICIIFLSKGAAILSMPGGTVLLSAAIFIGGGIIQSLQAPIFNIPADILGNRLSGTGVGIMNGYGYVGAAFAGVGFGWLIDTFGSSTAMPVAGALCICGAILSFMLRTPKKSISEKS